MKNTSFSFRIRCKVPTRSGISTSDASLTISPPSGRPEVLLRSLNPAHSLADTPWFVISGDGYGAEEDAWQAATRYRSALIRAFAKLRIAVDFGERAPQGGLSEEWKLKMEKRTGRLHLSDVHGMMVFPSEPTPNLSWAEGGIRTTINADIVADAVADALGLDELVPDREILAYDLFSASFFAATADARFLNLMMAVETLIDQQERSQPVLSHLDELKERTRTASFLPESDRNSLMGALDSLRNHSVRQAGKKLASTLQRTQYQGMEPEKFFGHCYSMRSSLVHGRYPRPSRTEVGTAGTNLEKFVGDLLAGPLRSIHYGK